MNTIYIGVKREEKRERKIEEETPNARIASGYYRRVINIVSLTGARQGIMITLLLLSRGWRSPNSVLNHCENFCWRLDDLMQLIGLRDAQNAK